MLTAARSSRLTSGQRDAYERDGFLVLKSVFSPGEMLELRAETDWLLTERRDLIDRFNLRCRFMPHHETGEPLFEVFDPVNDVAQVCREFCEDSRIVDAVGALYGERACLFKEKLIFKPAGAKGYDIHQDIPLAWKNFPRTFVTVLIPIDACDAENGCTQVYSGYHGGFLSQDPGQYMLPPGAVDPARRVDLALSPGDIAIFHGLTPHGSAANRSAGMRRAFFVS
ncbi:MAG TPA: phytanoyl-CoA dioxygenase family protein, partial [Caulifigura sp.]|nr:phytanoyl-CoA dioxygenase family protein [Caulifigura sp.]